MVKTNRKIKKQNTKKTKKNRNIVKIPTGQTFGCMYCPKRYHRKKFYNKHEEKCINKKKCMDKMRKNINRLKTMKIWKDARKIKYNDKVMGPIREKYGPMVNEKLDRKFINKSPLNITYIKGGQDDIKVNELYRQKQEHRAMTPTNEGKDKFKFSFPDSRILVDTIRDPRIKDKGDIWGEQLSTPKEDKKLSTPNTPRTNERRLLAMNDVFGMKGRKKSKKHKKKGKKSGKKKSKKGGSLIKYTALGVAGLATAMALNKKLKKNKQRKNIINKLNDNIFFKPKINGNRITVRNKGKNLTIRLKGRKNKTRKNKTKK